MASRLRRFTVVATATPLILAVTGLAWIGYQSCTVLVADVPGAPIVGCGSTEYTYFALAAASLAAAVAAVWIGLRGIDRRT